MTSQVPFTPLTSAALSRLTGDEQASFTRALLCVAEDRRPPLSVLADLVEMVQRLITRDHTEDEPDDETPGYWQVRAALSSALNALQLVALSPYGDIAAMAKDVLAKADAALECEPERDTRAEAKLAEVCDRALMIAGSRPDVEWLRGRRDAALQLLAIISSKYATPPVAALRAYLAAAGWTEQPPGVAGSLWTRGGAQIAVGRDDAPDLESHLTYAIERVASAEGRSMAEVIRDINSSGISRVTAEIESERRDA